MTTTKINLGTIKLSTSNENKLKEFQRIVPNIVAVKGKDVKEVDGTMDDVIVYKSLEMGEGFLVEDTILKINNVEVVDIKWNQEDKLKDSVPCSWVVSLGYNDGEKIYVFRGVINGNVVEPLEEGGFGFDPFFLPDGSDITLAQLENEGNKDKFSARTNALVNLIKGRAEFVKEISEIKPWEGKYQNED